MKALNETLLVVACAACVSTQARLSLIPDESLVGGRFIGQLAGGSTHQARLITTPGNYEYALHDVFTSHGRLLLMTRLVGRDSADRPDYEVLAAVSVPLLRPNELLLLGACKLNGVQDVDIIVIARRQDRAELTSIRAA